MSISIPEWHVEAFKQGVYENAQQKGSRLRNAVRVETVHGKRAAFDRLGPAAAVKRTTRHADTTIIDVPHSRRWLTLVRYDWAALIDEPDKVRSINDPTGDYQRAAMHAHGRAIDDAIIDAADGTAVTGEDAGGSQTFDSDMVIDVQVGSSPSADVGLNVAKLIEAKRVLDANDVDPDQPRFVAVNARQLASLLNQTEVTSSDYNTVKALVEGSVDRYLGFTFVRTERIGVDENSDDKVLFWAQDGIVLGIGQEATAKVTERDDKNYSVQVFASMDIGAVRMEEEKVGYIECDPTAGPR